ncbi:cutinase family protein [Mycolicibacterium psychrotolerans]|uniref:Putative cutinase n=1 Tax=Mycolicibacterium psychrotolerans TaxID=216929 RepID=A0A7I7MDE3_9MYCO|nr:cutinase family protein [Mycolicibacterium psychrotolerans]BBX70185.1 putative cutinase [Mycolicibacterium psychrotolerans]
MSRGALSVRIGMVAAALAAIAAVHTAEIPRAAADPCAEITVVFARGTGGPPGVGAVGERFIDALRQRVGDRSIDVRPVNYPASWDFRSSANSGAADARAQVESIAAACPDTRIVLGGTSQGAGVITLITTVTDPVRGYVPSPLPSALADRVAAVVVFGNPVRKMAGGGPLSAISPLFGAKTIDLCAGGDPFCSNGMDFLAHGAYLRNGMTEEAADFVAGRV